MKTNTITSLNQQPTKEIDYGTVQGVVEDKYIIHSKDDIFNAERAFSCTVVPEKGDQIMYCCDDNQSCHILAIIDRPSSKNTILSFPGDVSIEASSGKLSITGRESIQVASTESVTMVSENMNMVAQKGLININEVTLNSKKATNHVSRVTTFSKSIDTIADRVSQKLMNSFRLIEGVDQTKAGDVLTTIKNLFSLRSHQSAILSKNDIKIDAKRIHMG